MFNVPPAPKKNRAETVPHISLTVTAKWSLYVPTFNNKSVYVLPTQLYLCVLCGSWNKQRLFPYTTLTDWFV